MTLLFFKVLPLLILAVAAGWALCSLRFRRNFVEMTEAELEGIEQARQNLTAERDALNAKLAAETEQRQLALTRSHDAKQRLAEAQAKIAEQALAVADADARIEAATAQLREENARLQRDLMERESELRALKLRLASAEATIKRKTDLLRMSEGDPSKAKQSYRPPDSSRAPALDTAPRSTDSSELARIRSEAARRSAELDAARAELARDRARVRAEQARAKELEKRLEEAALETQDRASQVDVLLEQIRELRASLGSIAPMSSRSEELAQREASGEE